MEPEALSAFSSIKTESRSTLDSGPNLRDVAWREKQHCWVDPHALAMHNNVMD